MEFLDRKTHWENIYQTKNTLEVSWFQKHPKTSINLIGTGNETKKIIDVGGGDSHLVDHLLKLGFQDITVLDISKKAIESAKKRLGEKAEKVKWIVSDITNFIPTEKYDIWHDRAAFHFLTDESEIKKYIQTVQSSINPGGTVIMGTFSTAGPTKCSGIEIKQYTPDSLTERFTPFFNLDKHLTEDHKTPSGKTQNFVFCRFTRLMEDVE
ncbi:MAG: class I SAM-dependent methyltransferase [Cryomorphaceae bacterium]|nr:class I SAM-dependent methyltransferase [Cryomorphaceae bacterium]